MKLTLLIFLSIFTAITSAQNLTNYSEPNRKLHVCPKRFVKIGRRCYFFSKNTVTWQNAYYKCRERNSNIAIIKTASQDSKIRNILSRPTHATQERWLGGMYNWKQMRWVWAVSGKPIIYKGFLSKNFTENEKWHCIILDPNLGYRWNTKPCIEKKAYICHTKTKVVNKNDYQPLDELDRRLNEIPYPKGKFMKIPSNLLLYPENYNFNNVETNSTNTLTLSQRRKRRKKNKKKKLNNTTILLHRPKYRKLGNGTLRRNFNNLSMEKIPDLPMETIKYEIYKEVPSVQNSLYPKPIVEEYSIVK